MLSAGMDRHRDNIVEAIRTVFPNALGIVEKNMAQTRLKEGLTLREGPVWGTVPETVDIVENGLTLRIDLVGGQKTGYFLDQKINRAVVASLARGRTVLDCFCNVGGFALNAAAAGAHQAVGVDSSAVAIAAAQRNAEINGLTNARFETANVFDLLREHAANGTMWDMVILDPPSFAKSRAVLRKAHAGYGELNRLAMKVIKPGGILVSASCTQLVPEAALLDIIYTEAARLRKRLRLLHRCTQSPDHPVLLSMPETQYLKLFVFDVHDSGSC
jgi:23S rRNA (cytosine1962-C5)-methyltransferase